MVRTVCVGAVQHTHYLYSHGKNNILSLLPGWRQTAYHITTGPPSGGLVQVYRCSPTGRTPHSFPHTSIRVSSSYNSHSYTVLFHSLTPTSWL
jgi:hypothetical protein